MEPPVVRQNAQREEQPVEHDIADLPHQMRGDHRPYDRAAIDDLQTDDDECGHRQRRNRPAADGPE